MNCSDTVCQQLMTCKWDMPIASRYCEAIWYPKPEPEPIPSIWQEPENKNIYFSEPPPQPKPEPQPKQEEGGYKWNRR